MLSPLRYAALTMDVEDWAEFSFFKGKSFEGKPSSEGESVMDGFDSFLGLLEKEGVRGTFFVLSSRLEEDQKRLLLLKEKGHEIALHGQKHIPCSSFTQEELVASLKEGKKELQDALGISIVGNRFPGWVLPQDVSRVLKEAGLKYDATYTPVSRFFPHFGKKVPFEGFQKDEKGIFRCGQVAEFAMPVAPFMGFRGAMVGGGPLVRFPFERQFEKAVDRALENQIPFVFYCHPFEFSSCPVPKSLHAAPWEKAYLTAARSRYLRRVEWLIHHLKEKGFVFLPLKEIL